MKVLLIQLRPDSETEQHELECFVHQSGLKAEDVVSLNVLEKIPSETDLNGVDALVIGGSGDYLLSNGDIPEKVGLVGEIIRLARGKQIPTLGICFGAQILAQTFGGVVELDEANQETGTFLITKKVEAKDCPVFSEIPESFEAQLGHKDHIMNLPVGAVNLASSVRSSVQAFTFPGEPVYALTFHPELNKEAVHWRLKRYANIYKLSADALLVMQDNVGETPFAVMVLKRFFEKIVKNGEFYPNN
ncbi:hypothetical protein COY25_02225 [Candidatus Uhrbacteria bacterium CG_4_10_14_0_2_um_filter_41_7]|uniref:Glutamine amidotransferase domain-containing protein n=1 Tax=Candidatus Uhrbacteria bacterium CG_4_9_14_3_um_filter_41_35 TaxID=1975034 RepID=A0A2M7XFQ6_9BACT|nr:MAG: hypothetical protein COV92_00760 [Candidatus Uhrbacteria bacterium CG11_big_fil_rev_8_21_14_0_20_41_9]PIZ54336.1 MAG: hypothetical protein COY25_02225 [Candidatus Uhrbacteria bacterium CG_4_10_14_0_2_um_filter_41_7]PJA46689.1 MAG: hypothetical protein CO173_02890 [Candidatus Uhrbacteria bacterium CG_4_9_14_3_um_filter_41_35]